MNGPLISRPKPALTPVFPTSAFSQLLQLKPEGHPGP